MERKLIIYETTHFEILPSLVKLAAPLFDRICIFLNHRFTYEMVEKELLEYSNVQWIKRDEAACNNRDFIKQMFQFIRTENYTHLHISTIDHNLLHFAYYLNKNKQLHVSLTVHSINSYIQYQFGNIKKITESAAKLFLHKRIRHYRVLSPAMVAYLEKNSTAATVQFIPSDFYQSQNSVRSDNNIFRIVIPGGIDHKRRNYEHLVEVCKHIATISLPKPVEIVLLGSNNNAYAKKITQAIREIIKDNPGIRLVCFEQQVPNADYAYYLNTADIIFSPLQKQMRDSPTDPLEITGTSHSTGFLGDLLKYASPSVIPYDIKMSDDIDDLLYHYNSPKEAEDIICRLMTNPEELKARRNALIKVLETGYTERVFVLPFRKISQLQ